MSAASQLCACGRPCSTGRTCGGTYAECLICWTARTLAGVKTQMHSQPARRPYIICRCCKVVGPHAGHGLIRACYRREWLRRGR